MLSYHLVFCTVCIKILLKILMINFRILFDFWKLILQRVIRPLSRDKPFDPFPSSSRVKIQRKYHCYIKY